MRNMTGRERLLAAARGEPVDRLPWAPRIDMWYNAHRRQQLLPTRYESWEMNDVVRELGGAPYSNGCLLFTEALHDVEVTEEMLSGSSADQGSQDKPAAGMNAAYGTKGYAWEQTFPRDRRVHYHTPLGTVSQRFQYTPEMQFGGTTVPYQVEHWIKNPADYAVVEYIIEHTEYHPNYSDWQELDRAMGEDGLAFAWMGYSPFHRLMREFLGYEQAIYELQDHPQLVDHLFGVMVEKADEIQRIAVQSPAQIVAISGNWNPIISPPIFQRYFIPYLQRFSRRLHEAGKIVSGHVDGEMKSLLKLHPETGEDIAEGLTPWPMSRFTLEEARAAYGSRMTIWGGLPAIIFSQGFPEAEFRAYVEMAGRVLSPGRRVVLGMGDNLPFDAELGRVSWISEWAAKYPVA